MLLLFVFFVSDIFAQKPEGSTIILRENWVIESSANLKDKGKIIFQPGYVTKDLYTTSVPATVLAALAANKVYADP